MNDDVKEYFHALPNERFAHLQRLHSLIVDIVPDATVDLLYKMPTYRVGDGWVAIANQEHYVSLCTCGAARIAAFKRKHPNYKTGKGCINFKEADELPIDALREVVAHAFTHPTGS